MRGDRRRWKLCLTRWPCEPATGMCRRDRHWPPRASGHLRRRDSFNYRLTAYALSAGGPVITPECPVLQLTPIAPHSLASRALVFSDQEPVTVFPATPERLIMVVDGSAGCYVWPEDRVLIRRSDHPVRFVRLADHEFFQVLRNKLGWGLPHVAKPDAPKPEP